MATPKFDKMTDQIHDRGVVDQDRLAGGSATIELSADCADDDVHGQRMDADTIAHINRDHDKK